jgi:hypothetical protein
MDITFSLQNGQYIAEFKVTSEFNLHIEKGVGTMQMLQRTSGTFFDKVEDFKMEKGDVVYDFDSGSFIGEKTIRLVSSVEPRYCFITTSGEVTEIKSQSKEVEVTANGTMDITPDAGFSYLNSVKVKTNVATSGGGGGSASSVEYIDVAATAGTSNGLGLFIPILAHAVRIEASEDEGVSIPRLIGPSASVLSQIESAYEAHNGEVSMTPLARYRLRTRYAAIDFNGHLEENGQLYSILEYFILNGATQADIDALPRITKEQFYNLNA